MRTHFYSSAQASISEQVSQIQADLENILNQVLAYQSSEPATEDEFQRNIQHTQQSLERLKLLF